MFLMTFWVSLKYEKTDFQLWLLVANIMNVVTLLDFGLTPNYTRFCSYASCGYRRIGAGHREKFVFKLNEVCSTAFYMYLLSFLLSSLTGFLYLKIVTPNLGNSSSLKIFVTVILLIPCVGFYKYVCATFVGAGEIFVKSIGDAALSLLLLVVTGCALKNIDDIEIVIILRYSVPLLIVVGLLLYALMRGVNLTFQGSFQVARELYYSSIKTGIGTLLSKGTLLCVAGLSSSKLSVVASSQLLFSVQVAFAAQGLAITFASVQSKRIAKDAGGSNSEFKKSCVNIISHSLVICTLFFVFGYLGGKYIPEISGRDSMVGAVKYYIILIVGILVELLIIIMLMFIAYRGRIITHILCFFQMLLYFCYLFIFKEYLHLELIYYSIFLIGPIFVGLPCLIVAYRSVMKIEY